MLGKLGPGTGKVAMQYKLDGSRAILLTRMTPRMMNVTSRLEGRRKWLSGGGYSFEPTQHNLSILASEFPDLKEEVPAGLIKEEAWQDFDNQKTPVEYISKSEPYPHQKTALEKMAGKPCFALFMEQGTGKTKVAIDSAGQRFCLNQITGVLVISPKGVHRQWVESQLPRHCGVEYSAAYWPFKSKDDSIPASIKPSDKLAWFTINIEAINTDRGFKACNYFIAAHSERVLIIIDESHRIKNASSKSWKSADLLGKKVKHRLILTGTPIAKNLEDEWSQLKWLDERIIGIRYISAFRNEYCIMGGYENRQVIANKNIDRFKLKTEPLSFRATKDQIGILPKAYESWQFELTNEQLRMIREIKRDLQTEIKNGQIATAANAAVRILRAQQISNGFIIDEDSTVHHLFKDPAENPRIKAMLEYVNSREGKIIIWCRFVQDILMIKKVLGDECVTYYGANDEEEREHAINSFLGEGGARFFVSNPAAGGTGLNLQGNCNDVLYYSNSDNSIHRWQSEDRNHRIGTNGAVTYTDLIAKFAIDKKILSNLRKKKSLSQMALDDIKEWLDEDWEGSDFSLEGIDYAE